MATKKSDTDAAEDTQALIRPFNSETRKLMTSLGVPGADFMGKTGRFDLNKFFIGMETNLPNVMNKPISAAKQVEMFARIMLNPHRHPYLIGVSSYPSDTRAKYVAQTIMAAAIRHYDDNRKEMGQKSRPMWHRVWGNFKDSLREGPQQHPSMLIISNINDESSSVKIEKVRDLLEMYSDIPRIVVAGGGPVVDLFTHRLSLPMSASFYVGPGNLIKDVVP